VTWAERYIGAPYEVGGRGPAYDCLGLFLHLQRARRGLRLPDPACAMEHARDNPLVAEARSDWRRVQHPQDGDAALFRVGPVGLHIGYVLDGLHMLHIEGPEGAVIERLDSPRRRARLEGFYRHA
jgi:cell wall-associated NlpC family hydrolase